MLLRPTYHVVDRRTWLGTKHSLLYAQLLDICRTWDARWVVIDSTGVGAGLTSFLAKALRERLIPFAFNTRTKSDLGWDFLAVCDTGRFKDHKPDKSPEWLQFWREVDACDYEVVPGPGKRMKWGVIDPTVHDDLLISAAMIAVIDSLDWALYVDAAVIEADIPYQDGKF